MGDYTVVLGVEVEQLERLRLSWLDFDEDLTVGLTLTHPGLYFNYILKLLYLMQPLSLYRFIKILHK